MFGSEFPHLMLPNLTSRSRRPSSRPRPVSAGRWPASPEHGPAPPPPAGSCGSKTPPHPRPVGAHRGRGGDDGSEGQGGGGEERVKDQVTVRKHTADTKGKMVSRMAKGFTLVNGKTKTSYLYGGFPSALSVFYCFSLPA